MPTSFETVPVVFPTGETVQVLPHREKGHHFGTWEAQFLTRLMETLRPGSVVFDVGAEQGEFACLMAKRVGAERVHLIEPMPENWPNMRSIWEANGLGQPGGCWPAFFSDVPRSVPDVLDLRSWPACSIGDMLPDTHFGVVSEHTHLPAMTLDDYVRRMRVAPSVVTIDVEGAEGLVLTGAIQTLMRHRPTVFVAIHAPEALARFVSQTVFCYRPWAQELLFRFMVTLGYQAKFIADDHEAHWVFTP